MSFVDHEDVVEALSPDRSDHPLDVGRLPRGARSNENLLDSHAANPIREVGAIDPVAVTEQIPGCRVVGGRFHDLLGCPASRRMTCDVEVNDGPLVVPENHEADEDAGATRLCWSKGKWRCDDFMKLRLSSSGCETRPARGEPARAGSEPCDGPGDGAGEA